MSCIPGWLRGGLSLRRLASGGLAAVLVPLLLFASSEAVAAEQVAPSRQITSQQSNGIVPNVAGWRVSEAFDVVEAAGFVVDTAPGWVDCSAFPFVQYQSPAGGTSAPLGSTVVLYVNQMPSWPDACP